jgi:hypothetical protein
MEQLANTVSYHVGSTSGSTYLAGAMLNEVHRATTSRLSLIRFTQNLEGIKSLEIRTTDCPFLQLHTWDLEDPPFRRQRKS